MRHSLGISDVRAALREAEEDVAAIVTTSMREAGELLQADLRDDVETAGLGARLGRTWRLRVYPQRESSLDAVAWVWTKAPNIIDAYDRGVTIRARNGSRFLAIPTDAGRRLFKGDDGKRRRATPKSFEAATGLTLRYVPRRGSRPALYVVDGARLNARGKAVPDRRRGASRTPMTIAVFVLLPNVKVRRRLDVGAAAERAAGRVDAIMTKNWK